MAYKEPPNHVNPAADTEPCDVCAAAGPLSPYLEVSLGGVFPAMVCRCTRCGFRQVRPRLTPAEIASLYPSDYFNSRADIGFGDYARQQQRYEREAHFLARRLRGIAPRGRLLEVGCALGFLLDGVRRRCDWETCGLDISPFAAYFARRRYGLDVQCNTLEGAGYPDASFDLIIQKDLLEHVGRPRDHLQETSRILRKGGLVLIVTPNGEANLRPLHRLARRLNAAGDDRLPLLDQGHLSFFSRQHVHRLLDGTGLTVVRFRNIAVRRGLRALGYLPRKRRKARGVPRGRSRGETSPRAGAGLPDPVSVGDDPGLDELYKQVDRELAACRSRVRNWRPYFYWRHLQQRLDTLPAPFVLGNDFEILVRKIA